MSYQLPLNEIFEYLEKEKFTLYSCLLVNHLWFKISVRILWRDIWSFKPITYEHQLKIQTSILSTLVACFPNESKNLLYKNEIFITPPTLKPPLFNYTTFCKVLSIYDINQMVEHVFQNQQLINSEYHKYLVLQEILKLFMKQISSLKELKYNSTKNIYEVVFTYFPGAKDCLTNLMVLNCTSNIYSDFFYELSQLCHNIQLLIIKFEDSVSDGLKAFITLQKTSLKYLSLLLHNESKHWTEIISPLTKHSNTLIKLKIKVQNDTEPISFIPIFINLQELILLFDNPYAFEELENAIFSQLQILEVLGKCLPMHEFLIKFLENNGKNLKELYLFDCNNQINLAITKFCPNLKKLKVINKY